MSSSIARVTSETGSPPAPPWSVNARLTGLRCLHCARSWPLSLHHSGCPVCAQAGVHVSLAANYANASTRIARSSSAYAWGSHLPYTHGVALGEGDTPLTYHPELAHVAGVARLGIKDESCNPTGSHKDRMSALGVTQALAFGAHTVVLASSGNAAISAACYAKAAGLACEVATYADMPMAYTADLDAWGAQRFVFADNAARWAFVQQRATQPGYFALTNHHLPALGSAPLAIEGYKCIAYECFAEGYVPQHVVVPTARGDLAWGIYAGFVDLQQAGHIDALPKIWIVEPFARLRQVLEGGDLHASFFGHTAQFSTAGSTVTYLQRQAAEASQGGAVVVPDGVARTARQALKQHGISAELCAAAGFAAIGQLRAAATVRATDTVLMILTANSSRDPSLPDASP